jgi:hypothetical protein
MASSSSKTVETRTDKKPYPGSDRKEKYNYVLDWIKESNEARRAQNAFVERTVLAYQGKPSANRYKKTINQYVEGVAKSDAMKAKDIAASLNDLPEKGSMVIYNATETLVAMAMGGVGQYEFGPYDPDMQKDPQTMDRLSAAAKSFYIQNHVDAIVPQYIRNSVLEGSGWMHLKQKNGKKIITLLETSQMITDPKRFKTNFSRFTGYHQRESLQAVKDRVKKTKGGGYVLKTLNDADVYLSELKLEMNSVLQTDSTATYLHDDLRRDLDIFYKPIVTRIQNRRTNENDPDYAYDGDEIECTYLYDHMNDMYFEIVNRRYIVLAKKNPLTRDIKCKYYDSKGQVKEKTKTVKLDDPFVELPFIRTFWDTYAISPLFYLLDDFDDLCAMESVLFHNLSIMAPITFIGQSSDAEKVSRIASVSGEVVEGLPQTFGVLNKTHDITPVVTGIQRLEEKVKRTMKAVDPFELQAMLGDRATAKEVVSASGQVAQGINQFLANIESAFACLGDKFIKLELIMNDEDYSFAHNGKYAEISREEMAGNYEINAKLVTSIKLEQEANSRKALELIQYLNGNEAIDQKMFLGTMIPITLTGLVNREKAEQMVLPAYRPLPDEVVAQIKMRAEKDAKRDDADKLDLSEYTPDQIDQMIADMTAGGTLPVDPAMGGGMPPEMGGMPPQGAPAQPIDPNTGLPVDPNTGQILANPTDPSVAAGIPGNVMPPAAPVASPEQAGIVANDPTGQAYAL